MPCLENEHLLQDLRQFSAIQNLLRSHSPEFDQLLQFLWRSAHSDDAKMLSISSNSLQTIGNIVIRLAYLTTWLAP